MSLDDYRIGVRYTQTGSVSIQLPLIATAGEIEYKFKDEEGNAALNNITIVASGSDLIDGDTTAIMNRNYMAIGLYNDGVSNWHIESYLLIRSIMAYIPELLAFEETLASTYDLSNGATTFTSSDISDYNKFNLQFSYSEIQGENVFVIEQSIDNVNWIEISETYDLVNGTGTFIIDKSEFTAKYVRVNLDTATAGTLTITLLAKR